MEALIVAALGILGCVVLYLLADLLFQQFFQRLFEPLRWWLTRIASSERLTPEQVSCSIRAIDGSPHGFSRTWTSGVATLEQGVIRFASGSAQTAIAVTSIAPLAADTSRGAIRSARVRVYTDEGPLEISMQRASIERMRLTVIATSQS